MSVLYKMKSFRHIVTKFSQSFSLGFLVDWPGERKICEQAGHTSMDIAATTL